MQRRWAKDERSMAVSGGHVSTHKAQRLGDPFHRAPSKAFASVKDGSRTGGGQSAGEQTERRSRVSAIDDTISLKRRERRFHESQRSIGEAALLSLPGEVQDAILQR